MPDLPQKVHRHRGALAQRLLCTGKMGDGIDGVETGDAATPSQEVRHNIDLDDLMGLSRLEVRIVNVFWVLGPRMGQPRLGEHPLNAAAAGQWDDLLGLELTADGGRPNIAQPPRLLSLRFQFSPHPLDGLADLWRELARMAVGCAGVVFQIVPGP